MESNYLKKFAAYGQVTFKSSLAYRFQFMASIILSPLMLVMYYFIWQAIYSNSQSGSILGYSFNEIMTYYILSLIIGHFIYNIVGDELQEKIIYGELASDMLKPLSLFSQFLSRTIADRLFAFIAEVLPVFLISFFIFRLQVFSAAGVLFFILSLIFAFFINFLISYLMGLFAFWVSRIESLQWLFFVYIRFMSGEFIPLEFLGNFILTLSKFMPFYYIRYGVIQQYLSKWTTIESLSFILIQIFWIVFLYIMISILWSFALKKFGAEGG